MVVVVVYGVVVRVLWWVGKVCGAARAMEGEIGCERCGQRRGAPARHRQPRHTAVAPGVGSERWVLFRAAADCGRGGCGGAV